MPQPEHDRGRPGEERPRLSLAGDSISLDAQRAKILHLLDTAIEEYGEVHEGLLEAIALGLVYVGEALRGDR
jgi:hypothetical protein